MFRQAQICECSCEGFLVPGEARRRGVAGTTRRSNGAFSRGARGGTPRKQTAFSRGARGGTPRMKTTRGQKYPQIPVDLGLTEHWCRVPQPAQGKPTLDFMASGETADSRALRAKTC